SLPHQFKVRQRDKPVSPRRPPRPKAQRSCSPPARALFAFCVGPSVRTSVPAARTPDGPMALKGARFARLAARRQAALDRHPTAGQIRKSITPDALISFIDSKPYKTLKRHLTTHGMTVAEYKTKFGLPNDYPTTAPAYSEARSAMAKALGLGQGGRKAKAPA